jgi:hypothetical protein
MSKRFHLAWFTNFTAGSWDTTFSHAGSPWDGKFHVEFALAWNEPASITSCSRTL